MSNRELAIKVIQKLRRHAHQALLAGGCVRDQLLARPAKDYDVATSAEPRAVMKLFPRTLKVGVHFGVVIVLEKRQQVEVATFRVDGEYRDGRHPSQVRFAGPEEDASRRDFTVNGMFYDPVDEVVLDYVDGRADIERRIIRTIGEPTERFKEDYLRMLRAVRFAAQLDFAVESHTLAAIGEQAGHITQISGERIRTELALLLTCPGRVKGAGLFCDTGLAHHTLPVLDATTMPVGLATLGHLRRMPSFPLTLAALLVGCHMDAALRSVQGLRLSRQETKHLTFLLTHRGRFSDSSLSQAELRILLAEPWATDQFALERAFLKATEKSLTPLCAMRRRIRALGGMEMAPPPLLDGHDLMALGVPAGPRLGACMKALYDDQLEGRLERQAVPIAIATLARM